MVYCVPSYDYHYYLMAIEELTLQQRCAFNTDSVRLEFEFLVDGIHAH